LSDEEKRTRVDGVHIDDGDILESHCTSRANER